MKWQGISRRKSTGGRLRRARGKRKFEAGREAAETHVGAHVKEDVKKVIKARGGTKKCRLLRAKMVNVVDRESGVVTRAEIETVVENLANQHYVRRDIVTKGAVIKTSAGIARVTSKPGQDGIVNAVLIE
ncbi:30S ribosomal protein S8e [Candidatus Methanoperedenaceae archaeon GB37]|nr:30S ribosomal protein S8e [Candidatus Methanoperedenaceae archaeon GB37]